MFFLYKHSDFKYKNMGILKKQLLIGTVLFIIFSIQSYAVDSLKTYRLGEINIYSNNYLNFTPVNFKVNYNLIQELDVTSFKDLKIIIPSFGLQTNSRGETIFTYRGSQERQTNFFLDGALLSVTWDGRTDLDILNSNIIGGIEFLPVSVLYGPNNMMGTISLTSFERVSNGFGGTVRIQAGDGSGKNISLTHDGRIDNFNYILAFNYFNKAGDIASKNMADDFLNYDYNSNLITNSHKKQMNFYTKVENYLSKKFSLGASLNYSKYDKGVISEQYKLPSKARFWKYNDNDRLLFTLNSNLIDICDNKNKLKLTYWLDKINQNIDSYTDISFSKRKDNENNNDITHGIRIINLYNFTSKNSLSFAANSIITDHNETINEYAIKEENKEIIKDSSINKFSQNLFSLGIEYTHLFFKDKLETKIGIEYDFTVIPKAGLFIEANNTKYSDWGAIFIAKYLLTPVNNLFFNASRKNRVPSLREAYSAALGKFKINPNLAPESNILFEIGHLYRDKELSLRTTLFSNIYYNMIVKTYDSESSLEMRDNIGKAEIYGFEFIANYIFNKYISLNGNITYMYSKGEDGEINVSHLDYRPVLSGGLIAKFNSNFGVKSQTEVDYIGEQFALTGDNNFDKLEASCFFNIRLSYELLIKHYSIIEFYLRLNNITDVFRQVKIGIPAAGRELVGGIFIRI